MDALDLGEKIGYLVGSIALPIFLGWLIVWKYEKIKKIQVKNRKTAIVVIGVVIFLLSLAGRAGVKKPEQTNPPTTRVAPTVTDVPRGTALADGWQHYEFASEGLAVDFPAPPRRVQYEIQGRTIVVYGATVSGTSAYTAGRLGDIPKKESEASAMLRGIIQGAVDGYGGRTAKNTVDTFQENLARFYEIVNATSTMRGVVFAVKNAGIQGIYNLQTTEPADGHALLYDRFVNSFQLLSP